MTAVRAAIMGGAVAMMLSPILARLHPYGDAGLYAAGHPPTPIMEHSAVPPNVRAILTEKCADCHSLQTQTPFYGHFAPVSWVLENHIIGGRKEMNLSLWDTYPEAQQETLKAKIAAEVKSGDMPLPPYRLMHPNARITSADLAALTLWARGAAGAANSDAAAAGDPASGKQVFEKRCTGCHALERNREGPRLHDVYGRTSGEVADFNYSPALKKARIVWSDATLNRWLTDPDAMVPGNNMEFHVPKPQERQDLIAFLRQSAGK